MKTVEVVKKVHGKCKRKVIRKCMESVKESKRKMVKKMSKSINEFDPPIWDSLSSILKR